MHQFADDKPKFMDMSLFEHFFKGSRLYLEAVESGSASTSNIKLDLDPHP